jgi:hypothetical protein
LKISHFREKQKSERIFPRPLSIELAVKIVSTHNEMLFCIQAPADSLTIQSFSGGTMAAPAHFPLHSVRFPGESDSYRAARNDLLHQEVALRRSIEDVAALRRKLP